MQYLETYLKTITDHGNIKLAESISKTAEDVGSQFIKNFSFLNHEIGLLFGNIQSGKTGQMLGIICKATDFGFPVFLILTTDNIILQQQTLERVKNDLKGFCICGENDSQLFINNNLEQPTIVILKKNTKILKLWTELFCSTGFMKGNPIFIVDDEADAASLNTGINQGKQSSINKYLEIIKSEVSSSLYLQVTGTPQAIILQTINSGWHPWFIYYFRPGDGYLGGDFFFSNDKTPDCIVYLEEIQQPIKRVVIRHLIVSAQILASGSKVSNCLFHPSVRQSVHQKFADSIEVELKWCIENFENNFVVELKKYYDSLKPVKSEKQSFSVLLNIVKNLLINKKIKIIIMNGKNNVESLEYSIGCNFIIGGNTLGRGVTFPGLQTIYYERSTKKPQADTMWQHSRMFGYDRDSGMMKIFIDRHLYKLFTDINATNNSIIAQIEHGIKDIKIHYLNGLFPTRGNVLDKKQIKIISGGTNYYPFNPDNSSIEKLSKLLEKFSDKESYYQISLQLIKEILTYIIPSSDFELSVFQSIIETIISEKPTGQGILIVRRKRDITQGTGALLSSNDWQLGSGFIDKAVLTMYQVTGTKGWKNKDLWVPNIKLPHNTIYYDIVEKKVEK